MNLLVLLLKLLMSNSSLTATSNKTGISKELIRKLLPLAIPLLIKYMTRNAAQQGGAASLLSALTQHTSNRSMEDQINEVDAEDGSKIIGHILGDDKDEVAERLAKQSGLSKVAVLAILAAIAPSILNALSAANQTQVQQQQAAAAANNSVGDFSSLMNLFGGQQAQQVQQVQPVQQQPQSTLGLLGSLLGGQQPVQQVQQPSGLGLLGSLLGGQQAQQPVQQVQQPSGLGLLGSLMGGNAVQQQAQQPLTEASIDGTELLQLLSALANK